MNMDLAKYRNEELHINSREEVDNILARVIEVENLKSGLSRFDFDGFELEVRFLIRKLKVQIYFVEKFQELRKLYPQRPLLSIKPSIPLIKLHSAEDNKRNDKRTSEQVDKSLVKQNTPPGIYTRFTGESLESVAASCRVKPKILLEILHRESLKVDSIKSVLSFKQLVALRNYIESRLVSIERNERDNRKRRPSDRQIDKKNKPKGSVFAIPTQIRN